jgi:beta-glucosidase
MVQGLQNTGKYCFLKHLAIAETEYEREAMYTWLSEQTFREIYLKPFQRVIQDANCVGIMSSYNRVGGIWTGGSEQLLEGILRYEWGFKGAIITDYADHVEFMNGGHSNRAGGNLGLNTNWNKVSGFSNPSSSSTPRLQHRLREATKQILFMMCYVKYANDQYNRYGDTNNQIVSYSSLQSWVWWKPLLTTVQICAGGGILIGLYLIFRPTPTKKIVRKEDEING